MDDSLRHARHVGNPHSDCAVCVAKAEARHKRAHQDMAGVPVAGGDQFSVRAVGGYVQRSERFVR
jgi:hypothetical protein